MTGTASQTIEIVQGDIFDVASDLLVLKYADGFHGADKEVAEAIGFEGPVAQGDVALVDTPDHAFKRVMFLGVGPLYDFSYHAIAAFGDTLVRAASDILPSGAHITTTLHGVGIGLDERESLVSELKGMAIALKEVPEFQISITFVERDRQRAARLDRHLSLEKLSIQSPWATAAEITEGTLHEYWRGQDANVISTSTETSPIPSPPALFVAMPFDENYRDEYDIGFVEAAHRNNLICERLDLTPFTGDVIAEMERRIRDAKGIIALLNDANPNVFFETGYALALGKPLILVAKDGQDIPFDLRNMKRVKYSRIAELRDLMTDEIKGLTQKGHL